MPAPRPPMQQQARMRDRGRTRKLRPQRRSMKDWPCVQGKVETLSVTAMWDGPSIDDPDAKEQRRTPKFPSSSARWRAAACPSDKAEAATEEFADEQARRRARQAPDAVVRRRSSTR